MIVNNVELSKTAVARSGFPDDLLPEIAFLGRSNVGKSSLINSMTYRKALARTSKSPGKTRTINFYDVEGRLYFVDLPGYGYAKVSKTEKQKWGGMIEGYLKDREQLKACVLLIDIRHEPSVDDKMMFEWLKFYGVKVIIAATKSDKLKRSQIDKYTAMIRKSLGATDAALIPFSSETKSGRDLLWQKIEEVI